MKNAKQQLKEFAFHNNIEYKEIKIFQNLKFFFHPSLCYEYINPTHKVLLTGKLKGTHRERKNNNPEKIAVFLRQYYPYYILASYLVLGVTIFRFL